MMPAFWRKNGYDGEPEFYVIVKETGARELEKSEEEISRTLKEGHIDLHLLEMNLYIYIYVCIYIYVYMKINTFLATKHILYIYMMKWYFEIPYWRMVWIIGGMYGWYSPCGSFSLLLLG